MISDPNSTSSRMQEEGTTDDQDLSATQRVQSVEMQGQKEDACKLANRSNKVSEPNGGEREDDNEAALLAVELETGVRHRRVKSISDATEEGEVIANPLSDKGGADRSHWLTVRRDNDDFQLIVDDGDVKDVLMDVLSPCFDHYGNAGWQGHTVDFTSEDDFFPLLDYYQEVKDLCARLELDKPGCRLNNRLKMLLQYAQHFARPSLSKVLEALESTTDFYFEDLWVLFRAGTLIVAPWFPRRPDIPQVFKVHSAYYQNDYTISGDHKNKLTVLAWLWAWDDSDLVRKMYEIDINNYTLTRNLCSLACYPLSRYKHDGDYGIIGVLKHAIYHQRKIRFRQHTVERLPKPCPPLIYSGDAITSRDHVAKLDEPIILDATNYIRNAPRTSLGYLNSASDAYLCSCKLCLDDNTKAWAEAFKHVRHSEEYNDNDLLLAPRVFGYALGRKSWCQFLLPHIEIEQLSGAVSSKREIIFPEEFLEDEQADILRMVQNHHNMMAKPVQNRLSDQIGRKGDSLILLFHGSTGTGKTLYAEWLSKLSKRPLYKVGINDIGLEANEAEKNLKEIFELAEAWKAILLIDEADVLLDDRGQANQASHKKNALVSVLLREVEYFKGILILTTNRISAFDSAVLSRLHHAVNFGVVTKSQEEKIWTLWLNKAKDCGILRKPDEIERWIWSLNPKRSHFLNGREIRNVFLIAQDLHGDGMIHKDDLQRIYDWKVSFKAETREQTMSAENLLVRKRY